MNGKDGDLLFETDTSPLGQFVRQWKLRMTAQGAAFKGVAYGKLRRLLGYNKSFHRAGVKVEGSVLFY